MYDSDSNRNISNADSGPIAYAAVIAVFASL